MFKYTELKPVIYGVIKSPKFSRGRCTSLLSEEGNIKFACFEQVTRRC